MKILGYLSENKIVTIAIILIAIGLFGISGVVAKFSIFQEGGRYGYSVSFENGQTVNLGEPLIMKVGEIHNGDVLAIKIDDEWYFNNPKFYAQCNNNLCGRNTSNNQYSNRVIGLGDWITSNKPIAYYDSREKLSPTATYSIGIIPDWWDTEWGRHWDLWKRYCFDNQGDTCKNKVTSFQSENNLRVRGKCSSLGISLGNAETIPSNWNYRADNTGIVGDSCWEYVFPNCADNIGKFNGKFNHYVSSLEFNKPYLIFPINTSKLSPGKHNITLIVLHGRNKIFCSKWYRHFARGWNSIDGDANQICGLMANSNEENIYRSFEFTTASSGSDMAECGSPISISKVTKEPLAIGNKTYYSYNPVAYSEFYIVPPPCNYDSENQIWVSEIKYSGQIFDRYNMKYPVEKICYSDPLSVIRADTGQRIQDYDMTRKFMNGESITVPPSSIVRVDYVTNLSEAGVSFTCEKGQYYNPTVDKCMVAAELRPCPEGQYLSPDGTCIASSVNVCPSGTVWQPTYESCAMSRCKPLSDTAQWIPELKKCGEPINNPCNYNIGTVYDFNSNSCIWNLGQNNFEDFENKNNTCYSLGGYSKQTDYIGGNELGPVYKYVCHLPPNPSSMPEGTTFEQGNNQVWAVYPTVPDCQEGYMLSNDSAACIPYETVPVEKLVYVVNQSTITEYVYKNQTVYRVIKTPVKTFFSEHEISIILISLGVGMILANQYMRRKYGY